MCSLQNQKYFFQEVSLYLSPLRRQKSSAPLAVFTIPALSTAWNRLAVQVGFSTLTWISPGLPGGRWPRSSLPQLSGGRLDQHWQAPGVQQRQLCQNKLNIFLKVTIENHIMILFITLSKVLYSQQFHQDVHFRKWSLTQPHRST